jgi:hypothetical protein
MQPKTWVGHDTGDVSGMSAGRVSGPRRRDQGDPKRWRKGACRVAYDGVVV